MKAIYITAMKPFSGKTSVSISILAALKDQGLKVGYFKPFGSYNSRDASYDTDVRLMKNYVGLSEAEKEISPIMLPKFWQRRLFDKGSDKLWKKIETAYEIVSKDKDIVVIEGSDNPHSQAFLGMEAPKIAQKFNAEVIIVSHGTDADMLDEVLGVHDYFIARTNGEVRPNKVLFTAVSKDIYKQIDGFVKEQLANREIKILAIIPEDVHLKTPTVRELAVVLKAQILLGEENLEKPVQDIAIGMISEDSALSFFRRFINKAVVLSGDRVDIALAALQTSTSCLVLTNNLYPDEKIIYEAKEANNTPLLLVPYGTRATVNIFESSLWRLKPHSGEKIAKLIGYFQKHVDFSWLKK